MQRLRVRFSRGQELKFISHLDIMRLWLRALTRAGLSLAYSEGFNPHPRMSLAVPLAVGITSDGELMDIGIKKWVSPHSFVSLLGPQLPAGIEIKQVYLIPETMPSLQSQASFAEYEVEVDTGLERKEVESAVRELMLLKTLPWEHQRDTGPKRYDLRALINEIRVIECGEGRCTLEMRLRCDNVGSGRPEQVAAALGFESYPRSIHRTALVLRTS